MFEFRAVQKCINIVDLILVKKFQTIAIQTSIHLQKSGSIQTRTGLSEFDKK